MRKLPAILAIALTILAACGSDEDAERTRARADTDAARERSGVAGPSVAKIQILLDQARFSPGTIDGRWGKNTEKAIYYFQETNGLNGAGEILYHFPSTLGADYSPSPMGEFGIESITFHPEWHYQPDLLADVDPEDDDAVIPAGPNNDVGIVWMALSEPHYGIHGTKAPETIGYTTSSGCVRLTNWDAAFLAQRVAEGAQVEFTDIGGSE
jgi:lipoprotein-anchoring transpeptidase ErfK/SrfK